MKNTHLQLPFITALIALILVLSFFILKPFLIILTLAIVCAVIVTPFYRQVLKRTRNNEGIASFITVAVSGICVIVPIVFLGSRVLQEAAQLYNSLNQDGMREHLVTSIAKSTGNVFEKFLPGADITLKELSLNIDTYIKDSLAWLIDHLGTALSGISTFLLDLLIFFISLYYLICDGPRLRKMITTISPFSEEDDEIIFSTLQSAIKSVIVGNLFIAIIQGVVTGIGFAIFGVPNSILWGMLTIIAALVPRIGTALVILPAVIYLFTTGHPLASLGLTIWGMFIVGIIDNILGPKLIGKRLGLHPLFILLSVVGGLIFFGPAGIFLGPLTMRLLFALVEVYTHIFNNKEKKR